MKYLKILIYINILFFVFSCGTLREGFTNQKKNSSDEFMVEKKSPLVLPPNYDELTIPGSLEPQLNENKIKDLVSTKNEINNETDTSNQNFEKSLLKKIKKN